MLPVVASGTVFMILGYYMKQITDWASYTLVRYITFTSLGFLGGVIGIFFVNIGDIHLNRINNYPLPYLLPSLFCFSCILLFRKMSNSSLASNIASRISIWIAQNGIVILACHMYLIFVADTIIRLAGVNDIDFVFLLKLLFVASLLFLLIIPFVNCFLYRFCGMQKKGWKGSYKL